MHQKHPALAHPGLGYYARTEFALVGSTCARMEALMDTWTAALSPTHHCLQVTGEHSDPPVPLYHCVDRKRFTSPTVRWNAFDDKLLGQHYDLVLVNGNHYPARKQIVFVDEAKAGTLERRREQLTDIFAVVHVSGPFPDWLQEMGDRQAVPPFMTTPGQLDGLRLQIADEVLANRPSLRALILAGGKSERMGQDKASLVYRDGQTEVERLAALCEGMGISVAVSVREPDENLPRHFPLIQDRFLGLGPAGAICSAFLHDPDTAWLVLACDLPLLDAATLARLVEARQPHRVATAVRGPGNEWPEPLIAIYEPRVYQRLLQFLGLGYSCPRKVLINSDVEVVELDDDRAITNANTPEERDRVMKTLD